MAKHNHESVTRAARWSKVQDHIARAQRTGEGLLLSSEEVEWLCDWLMEVSRGVDRLKEINDG